MYRGMLLLLVSVTVSLLSSVCQAQTYVQRCVNGKCTWVLVQPETTSSSAVVMKERVTFKKVLLQAAEESYKSGLSAAAEGRPLSSKEISRLDLMRIRFALLNPKKAAEIESVVADQMVTDGHIAGIASIDWAAWKEIIKELLPIILEIIKLLQ